jgi:hypothetical protein
MLKKMRENGAWNGMEKTLNDKREEIKHIGQKRKKYNTLCRIQSENLCVFKVICKLIQRYFAFALALHPVGWGGREGRS